jgi:16S rRNA (guanine527-N7)-methyltransferase
MNGVALIKHYFPGLSPLQLQQFEKLGELYALWNAQINVISRRDIDSLYEKHILHSLGIAKVTDFIPGTRILDVGTGGGFPGIPLAIMFPESSFHLVDSIGKKIKVVNEVATALGLNNVKAEQTRAEQLRETYDFVVSRAVTAFPEFYGWIKGRVGKRSQNHLTNGILYLKGGDLSEELKGFEKWAQVIELSNYFEEEFFQTKKVVYMAC